MAQAPQHGVLLTIAYDGQLFSGFARQANARTVAGELEGALRVVDPRASLVRAVSRTDAGVHARGQRIAFDTTRDIDARGWVRALSTELPPQIAVVRAARVDAGFDPRRVALRKTYRYVLLRAPTRDPFLAGKAWRVEYRLNQSAMQDEAASLLGSHDFRAFRSSADQRKDTTREVFRAQILASAADTRCLELWIEGDRFMHRMVRIIAGTLVDVGRGRLGPGAIGRAIASGSRGDLGVTAPPDGLYLEQVVLSDEGRDAWPH